MTIAETRTASSGSFPLYMFRKGTLFLMLTACFDGSGKDSDPSARFVTLAGFAAEEDGWNWLNAEWDKALANHPRHPNYIHMAEAVQFVGEFDGWEQSDVLVLVTQLSLLLAEVHRNCLFQGFRFTIDNQAHRKWSPNSSIPSIPTNLAVGVFLRSLRWYAETVPRGLLVKPVVLLYDRGEPYLNVAMQLWNRKGGKRGKQQSHLWGMIHSIAPVDMRIVPGVQAADMLAWSINRIRTSGDADWRGQIARRILNMVPHVWNEVEDYHMRRVKLPGEQL